MGPIKMFQGYRLVNALESAWNKTFWRTSQMGWKTVSSAALVAACSVLQFLEATGVCQGCGPVADALINLGQWLGLAGIGIGLRHAQVKGGK